MRRAQEWTAHYVNPLNAELNPIRHLLALAGTPHIVHVSRIRVNTLILIPIVTGTAEYTQKCQQSGLGPWLSEKQSRNDEF